MDLSNANPTIIVLAVCLILAIGIAVWMYMQKQRTQKLRSRFGPEYDRAVEEHHDRARAESELDRRTERVARFKIQPLKPEERLKYIEDWQRDQTLFVDDPPGAVKEADALVQDVMRRRGYPVGDFEQNASDLSVDHPLVVENYRIAHAIANREGRGTTEDLRKAMVSYHTLFDDLLETAEKPQEIRT